MYLLIKNALFVFFMFYAVTVILLHIEKSRENV